MIELQLEILLLVPFGMMVIKAVQALTEEYGLLRFLVAGIEELLEEYAESINTLNTKIGVNRSTLLSPTSNEAQVNYAKLKIQQYEEGLPMKKFKFHLLIFASSPLYRCPICMSSIWGSIVWIWWNIFSPLPIGTWVVYCLVLCGAMYTYQTWETANIPEELEELEENEFI